MTLIFKKPCSFLLPFLLVVAGLFAACTDNKSTFAYYVINGTIVDSATLKPIRDIQVIRGNTDYLLFSDTTVTDSLGKYSLEFQDYYMKKAVFTLKVEDIDLSKNQGEFLTRNIAVNFASATWNYNVDSEEYKAEATKTVDIKLKKK
jgi:putative lipoprotein (rSAM/lipoprotein system)